MLLAATQIERANAEKLFALAFAPVDRKVELGAIKQSATTVPIYASQPGRLETLLPDRGSRIVKGQVLAILSSPQIENEVALAQQQVDILHGRLARIHADRDDRLLLPVLRSEMAATEKKHKSLEEKRQSLRLVAPIEGVISDLDQDLHIGQWVGTGQPMARIIDPDHATFSALADEASISRIETNANGRFIPNDASLPAQDVKVEQISKIAGTGNLLKFLQDRMGGPVPVRETGEGEFEAVGAWYQVKLQPVEDNQSPNSVRAIIPGTIVLDAQPVSFANRVANQIAAVLVRESGF